MQITVNRNSTVIFLIFVGPLAGNLVESLHPLVIPQESRNFRREKHPRNLHTPIPALAVEDARTDYW